MIGVGINENVYLAAASIDDKAVIHITFKEVDKAKEGGKSLFAMAASDQVEEIDTGSTIMLFPPNAPKEDSTDTLEKKVNRALSDVNKVKGICLHLLRGYYTTEQLEKKMEPFAGTGLTEENFQTGILVKETLEVVQRNVGRVFIEMIKPHLNNPALRFRLLLIRQSTDKHFATMRGKYLDDQPFWESMDVPVEGSKVKFTDWEIANGFNSGVPSPKAAKPGGAVAPATAVAQSAENIFGG